MKIAQSWNLVALIVCATITTASAGLPLYFGFFPADNATELGLKTVARDTLTSVLGIEEVRQLYCNFTNHSLDTTVEKLSAFAYTNPTDELHVTSFYCNFGSQPGCASYANLPEVVAGIGRTFALNVTAVLLTPRTFGYRAELGPDALQLWANGEGESVKGQRAHFTVATSPGVGAVQTGLDLLAVTNRKGRPIGAQVLDFDAGQFLILLNKPVPVVFRPSDAGKSGVGLRPGVVMLLMALLLSLGV